MYTISLILGLSVLVTGALHESYALERIYNYTNFFNEFDFFTEVDPTDGYVEYANAATASGCGLVGYQNGLIYIGVDHQTVNPTKGRKSVRVTSKKSWSNGLFIANITHMPGGICGVWPAMWLYGPNWPASGEIDVIEGINSQSANIVTLHTSPGCTMTNEGTMDSTVLKEPNCHLGCSQTSSGTSNYGTDFNQNGGGIYVLEWTPSRISVWFFSRSTIPSDIASQEPDPSRWGKPIARFNGNAGCNINEHFRNNNLVIDTTFCGNWAGVDSVWESDSICSIKARSCIEFVAANPFEFAEAYWLISSIEVYQRGNNYGNHRNYTPPVKHISNRSFTPKKALTRHGNPFLKYRNIT
ncbi:concanavalin A-like lectin/glucanase domain-containing protein [Mariannaea sp. PMI_226]|nr:concanavalin A-like lectin/glucanase domain-containing protein [Mariannaea sp. PMI_226]